MCSAYRGSQADHWHGGQDRVIDERIWLIATVEKRTRYILLFVMKSSIESLLRFISMSVKRNESISRVNQAALAQEMRSSDHRRQCPVPCGCRCGRCAATDTTRRALRWRGQRGGSLWRWWTWYNRAYWTTINKRKQKGKYTKVKWCHPCMRIFHLFAYLLVHLF